MVVYLGLLVMGQCAYLRGKGEEYSIIIYTVLLYCSEALKEIFNRHDLDGNGAISRNEIEYYHERTSNEPFDDDHWKVLEG